jgi:hypothetical protein
MYAALCRRECLEIRSAKFRTPNTGDHETVDQQKLRIEPYRRRKAEADKADP